MKSKDFFPLCYAAYSKDELINLESSSGGVFFEIGKKIINEGGVVYGAKWSENLEVEHGRAENIEGLLLFRKSKYVRSKIGRVYEEVKSDLDDGRTVLFSGTPCQIAGLKSFIKSNDENLYTIEVVCHGVPIEKAFRKYIEERALRYGNRIIRIDCRDKRNGWDNNTICEYYEDGSEIAIESIKHPHHSLYIRGINVEAGCGNCKYAKLPRISDITLADYWNYRGAIRTINEKRGISLICINTEKGLSLFEEIEDSLIYDQTERELAINSCRHLSTAPKIHPNQAVFKELIEQNSFEFVAKLCSEFGEVRKASELTIMTEYDKLAIQNVFLDDTHEIVYFMNNGILEGIITFGEFLANYFSDGKRINRAYRSVRISDKQCIDNIRRIFAENNKINRIPILDDDGTKVLYEICRDVGLNGKNDYRRYLLPFYELIKRKNKCYFYKRPDYIQGYEYTPDQRKRIDEKLSFPLLVEKQAEHDYGTQLKLILGKRYSEEYIEGLCQITPIIKRNNRYQHKDVYSELLNIINGIRNTCYQPDEYLYTIHIYGRCGVFGYAVEDSETFPSFFQKRIKDQNVRVVNHSTWGAEDSYIIQNLTEDIKEGLIEPQDFVLIYMNYLPCMEEIIDLGIYVDDTTTVFHKHLADKSADFYDIPGHMNSEGYEIIAEYIYNSMLGDIISQCIRVKNKKHRDCLAVGEILDSDQKEQVEEFVNCIRERLPASFFDCKRRGAIVMNCNPFTKGHRYLIETASDLVDELLIFVVEEDKSYFPFETRLEMVKKGTEDIENVYVFPSGSYIVSAYSLPEYFFKEQMKSTVVDLNLDVEIFARYIAPKLKIKYRFVGTEPYDRITEQYNEAQKRILNQYDISLIEIDRLKNNEEAISANKVRSLLKNGEYEKAKQILYSSTIDIMEERGYFCARKD